MFSDFIADTTAASAAPPFFTEPFAASPKTTQYDIFRTVNADWLAAAARFEDQKLSRIEESFFTELESDSEESDSGLQMPVLAADYCGLILHDAPICPVNDNGDWLLTKPVDIRAARQQALTNAALREAELDAEYNDFRARLEMDIERAIDSDGIPSADGLFGSHRCACHSRTVSAESCAVHPIGLPAPKKSYSVLTFRQNLEDKTLAGQVFRSGKLLILILPTDDRAADACRQILMACAEENLNVPGRRDVGRVTWWTVTYQQLFDERFEVAPFSDGIEPDRTFYITVVNPDETRYQDAPFLLRDRRNACLCAWVREGYEASDTAAIRRSLRENWGQCQASQQYFRNESAWEVVQWLTEEELRGEYNQEGREILAEEVGQDRAQEMYAAAKIIAPLFDRFRLR